MGQDEDAKTLAVIAAAPELRNSEATDAFFDAMEVTELASMWCALQRLSRRDQIGGAWTAKLYFDHMPHQKPSRALDLVIDVLASEIDKPTVMQLNDKLMPALLYAHGPAMIDRIEREASESPALRWLLGGIFVAPDEPLRDRIVAIADTEAWRPDEIARRTPKQPLDCAGLTLPELACAWVEQYSKSDRDRDDNFFSLMDFEHDLREEDPDRSIDLILEILKVEANPVLLSLLAAGPLEDVISLSTIDRIEREAAANKRFADLLGGVWYFRAPEELKLRLDALIGDNRW
jgi:hypothetical protein